MSFNWFEEIKVCEGEKLSSLLVLLDNEIDSLKIWKGQKIFNVNITKLNFTKLFYFIKPKFKKKYLIELKFT